MTLYMSLYIWNPVIYLLICIWGKVLYIMTSRLFCESLFLEFVHMSFIRLKDLSTDCVDSKLFYCLKSKLINLLLFPSFPNSHHLCANFPNSKGPCPRYKWVGKSLDFKYILNNIPNIHILFYSYYLTRNRNIPHNFEFYFLFNTFLNICVTIRLPHNTIHIINFAHDTILHI
jgi:hypothetical protein